MYVVQVVLYMTLGGFAGWMTVNVNVIATVSVRGTGTSWAYHDDYG